jgi:hypothetical protein
MGRRHAVSARKRRSLLAPDSVACRFRAVILSAAKDLNVKFHLARQVRSPARKSQLNFFRAK